MSNQINFRLKSDELFIVKKLAKKKGISLAEYARKALEEKVKPERVDLAFRLLIEGHVGFKGAWKISGLEYNKFLTEWAKRGAVEEIPEEIVEKNIEKSKKFDWESLLK
ncbi:MAG: hypothetical protein K9W44_16460 [Candidatus Lokiarchaeota archaeon]|nr:hypothetical protein [Candidatus Harpocratesius repetitus]